LNKTKKKIIETTIQLFNEHGFANVKLPLIASTTEISLGNLTYHFPKKDQLIMSIFDAFVEDLGRITKGYQLVDLAEMMQQLGAFYDFQEKYLFFYLDLLELERAFPDLKVRYQAHIQQQIAGLHQGFLLNESTGLLKSFEDIEIYEGLALQYWHTVVFWRMQVAVRGVKSTKDGMLKMAIALLNPYLTAKGKKNLISDNKNQITKIK